MPQLSEAVKLLKKWRKTQSGEWFDATKDTRNPLELETDNFLKGSCVMVNLFELEAMQRVVESAKYLMDPQRTSGVPWDGAHQLREALEKLEGAK